MILWLWLSLGCQTAEPTPPAETVVEAERVAPGPTPLQRLSAAQYAETVRDLFGVDTRELSLPGDDVVGPFRTNVVTPVSPLGVDQYAEAAAWVAARAVRSDEQVLGCADPACVDGWLRSVGRRAWRRPLDEEEVTALRAVWEAGEEGRRGALVIEALLQTPDFLYLIERGTPDELGLRLDGYSLAARLSYFLWGTGPDDALLDAAARGQLDTPEGLEAEARRLLASRRAVQQIERMHLAWLEIDKLDRIDKDVERFPLWSDELREAMREDVRRFVRHVFTEGSGTLTELLTAPYAFPSGPLWEVYGLQPQPTPVGVPPEQRAGILTLPAVQAAQAHPASTSPIHRGVWVVKRLLCTTLGAPPDDVDITPIVVEPGTELTKRELFAQHQDDPACAGCHRLIDPVGFAFEHYGPLGEWRTHAPEEGQPVDAAVELRVSQELSGSVDGAVEMAWLLAGSEQVRECVTRQWYRFALGRADTEADKAVIHRLSDTMQQQGDDLRLLMLDIVRSEAFRHRVELP